VIEPRRQALICAALAVLAVLLWQWATVTANYGGKWTALFCTASTHSLPPELAGEHIYVFPNSLGYDGELYHYIAHDPFLRDQQLKSFIDAPRLRYRRILLPLLAWTAALGRPAAIDAAYIAVVLLSIGLGVFWSCELCREHGWAPAWGFAFLAAPAVLIGIDRMVTDVLLAALAAGFAVHWKRPSWRLFAILAAAALARETGVLFIAGYCLYLAVARRWTQAVKYAMAALPAAGWYLYVQLRTAPSEYLIRLAPLSVILSVLLHPASYPARIPLIPLVQAADFAAIAGMLAAFALSCIALRADPQPETYIAACFALAGVVFQQSQMWDHVYHYGRVFTPVLVFLAIQAMKRKSAVWLAPSLMIVPRIAMQLAPQAIGIARAVL
jgi:hypothetical protein